MNQRLFTISQSAVHSACFLVSFYVVWPLSRHMSNFCGHCALFSCGTYNEEDGNFEPEWASSGYCIYSIFVGTCLMLWSLGQLLYKLKLLYQSIDSTFTAAAIEFLVDCLLIIMMLIASLFVSVGYYNWCRCVTQRFNSCDIAASVIVIGGNSDTTVNPKNFPFHLFTAQLGVWTLFVCSSLQLMFSTKRVLLYHEQENLIVSMAREQNRYQNSYS